MAVDWQGLLGKAKTSWNVAKQETKKSLKEQLKNSSAVYSYNFIIYALVMFLCIVGELTEFIPYLGFIIAFFLKAPAVFLIWLGSSPQTKWIKTFITLVVEEIPFIKYLPITTLVFGYTWKQVAKKFNQKFKYA